MQKDEVVWIYRKETLEDFHKENTLANQAAKTHRTTDADRESIRKSPSTKFDEDAMATLEEYETIDVNELVGLKSLWSQASELMIN